MNHFTKVPASLPKALLYVWLFYSLCGLLAVIATLLLPENVVFENTPQCYAVKHFGKECFMCGSTRSFTALGNGELQQAWQLNKLAVLLYAGILVNTIIVLLAAIIIIKKQRKT